MDIWRQLTEHRGFAIVLSGAILTKQSGIFMVISFFVMSWYLLKCTNYSNKQKWKLFGLSVLICLLSAAPWYVYKQVQIRTGVENSEVSWVTKDIYAGKSKSQRAIDATSHFSNKISDFDVFSFADHNSGVLQYSISIFFPLVALLSVFSFTEELP
jgi:4-amino-4-deoxy-L-arabinose transferase-like glycosyltransferase